jgi:hypothetical protein
MTELHHTRSGDTLRHAQSGLPSGLYRVMIPAGTHMWRTGVQTYLHDEPASALASFDAPPIGPSEPCGPDTRHTLERLWAGATLSFYSPPGSGTLMLSQPESTSDFRADRDRWLYLQLNFPAGKALGWQSQIDLHADAAPAPLPTPSLDLAQRTLSYAHKAGLVTALMHTSKARSDDELIDWMLAQGDLWFSLCRMAGLVEDAR